MKYMLVNVGLGSLQVDLHSPKPSYNKKNLHRPGPVVALNIPRGESVDILPHFGGSVEKAHESVKFSRDSLRLLKPNMLHTYVCDDDGKPVDMEKLFGKDVSMTVEPVVEETVETETETTDPTVEETVETENSEVEETTEDTADTEVVETTEDTTGLLDDQGQEIAASTPDNLTEIKGIGEAMEQKLYEAGMTTYASIADSDLDKLSEVLGSKSKAKDTQKQAKKLVK